MKNIFTSDEPVVGREVVEISNSLEGSKGTAAVIPANWRLKVHSDTQRVGEAEKTELVLHFHKTAKGKRHRPIPLWPFEALLAVTALIIGLFIGSHV